MRLKGQAYSDRLRAYSKPTPLLISEVMSLPREVYQKGRDITTNSELNEAEVVMQLQELKNTYLKKTKTT